MTASISLVCGQLFSSLFFFDFHRTDFSGLALKEQVLRDGREITIYADHLVPGDVVLLAAGDLVPADGRVLEAKDFFVNEGLLTEESYPIQTRM